MANYFTTEFKRITNRFILSGQGIALAWREEASFSQWVAVNAVSLGAVFFVEMTTAERALIIVMGIMLLVVELLNTGIETAIDHISLDIHPLAKKAKDTACAAVALTVVALAVVWVLVLLD